MVRTLTFLVILVLVGCNGEPPPPPPSPPEECPVWTLGFGGCVCPEGTEVASVLGGVCAPPRVDRSVDWGAVRGVTAFSLALRSVGTIADFTYYVHERGWTTLRVGAQTSHDWCQHQAALNASKLGSAEAWLEIEDDLQFDMANAGYLPCGPSHASSEADLNLTQLLDVTARIPNTWVQLIPTFTYKSHDEGSQQKNIEYFNKMFDHVNMIVSKGDYKHVVYELFNEVEHPLSQHIKDEDVREMFKHARSRTTLPIGTDYDGQGNGFNWKGRYPYIWRGVSTYIAFHTPRNPEPSFDLMEAAQDKYNYMKPVFVDETVSWASDEAIQTYGLQGKGTIAERGFGTEDSRMQQVVKHLRDIHRLNWRPLYHSIWGITSEEPGRIPDYNRDIKGEN